MAARGQWLAVGIIVGLLAAALTALVALNDDLFPVTVGSPAPPFRAVDLVSGDSVAFADSASGQVVLLNIWATWCAPCEQEMPSMERLQQALGGRGLRIITVSVDTDDPETVLAWARDRHLTFRLWHDATGRIQTTYQTTGVPESFVIDPHGVIVKKVIGATEWDHPAQRALFERLLAGADSATARP